MLGMDELVEGIYLEVKRSKVGTGHTQSEVTFRNLYLVRDTGGGGQAVLLDDKLNPTGLCEPINPGAIASRGWRHVPQLQNRVRGICDLLGAPRNQQAAPPPAAKPAAPPPAAKPEAAPPVQRHSAPPPTPRPRPGQPAAQPDKSGEEANWWDFTSPGSGNLFGK
jgi:hypothetical protein